MTSSETIRLEDLESESERLANRLSEANNELLELREFVRRLHPDDVVSDLERPTPSFPFGEVNEFIFRFRHADGDFRTIRSRSTTYGSGDIPHRKLGAHIDMSSDPLLHLNSKLAEANARISQFSRIASHDLRSPLRAINSLTFLTLHDSESTLSPNAVEHLQRVINRIGHMDRLVCELLEYSTADLDQVAPTETDVNRMLADIVELVDSQGLTVEVDSQVRKVTTTTSPLTICVRNLVDNACKHHDRADGIVRVTAVLDEGWLEIMVSDDGPGIPEAARTMIFEPFYSSDSERGTGLGLAHVNRLVEQYHAHLELDSTAGEGTTFTLRWPVTGRVEDQRAPLERQ